MPELPENEEELDKMILEQSQQDDVARDIFENAKKRAQERDLEGDIDQKLAILQLCFNEMADGRRRLWEASLVANKLIKQMEDATKALNAARESSDNIVTGISNNIVKAQNTPMPVKLTHGEGEQLRQYRESLVQKEKEAMLQQHKEFMQLQSAYYQKLANLRWGGQDGLAIHGKWVKWIVGVSLTCILITTSMLVLGIVLLVNHLSV